MQLGLLHCAEPGQTAAQASATAHPEGGLIVITDGDIIPEPDGLQGLEQAADETPEASLFGGAITPLPVERYARGMRPQRAWGRTCLPSPLHPRGFVTGADTIFGPNLLLRRSEALRSLKGPFVLGSSSVLTVGKRVFARGDVSEMIARLEREGAKSMSVPEARAPRFVRDFQADLGFML